LEQGLITHDIPQELKDFFEDYKPQLEDCCALSPESFYDDQSVYDWLEQCKESSAEKEKYIRAPETAETSQLIEQINALTDSSAMGIKKLVGLMKKTRICRGARSWAQQNSRTR